MPKKLTKTETLQFMELCHKHTVNKGNYRMANLTKVPCKSLLHRTVRKLNLVVTKGKGRATEYIWIGGQPTRVMVNQVFNETFVVRAEIEAEQRDSTAKKVKKLMHVVPPFKAQEEEVEVVPDEDLSITQRLANVERAQANIEKAQNLTLKSQLRTEDMIKALCDEWGLETIERVMRKNT